MKKLCFKLAAIVLSLAMVLTMFSACSSNNNAEPDVHESVDAVVISTNITINADGRQITIEDANGNSIQQLLDMAGIVLNDGDLLSVDPNQMITNTMTIQVLRKCVVTITVATEEPDANIQHTAILMGGTVADAMAAVGLELTDDQIANYELDQALENGMEIIISVVEEVEEAEATEPDNSESDNSDSTPSTTPTTPPATTPTTPPATQPTEPPTTQPTEPPTTAPTEPERYVVSVEVYEDCDGSGHGVKVITYSDGTQEEVYF